MPAPRVADDVRTLPAERVEDATGILDIRRHRARRFRRGRLESSLLVPRDVVLLGELVGELAQVVEAEARPAVQQEHRRPATGATTREQRPLVVRREVGPHQARLRLSHAGHDDVPPLHADPVAVAVLLEDRGHRLVQLAPALLVERVPEHV